jgi:hypothetical protein
MGIFIGIFSATKNVTPLTPMESEDHLNRITENQRRLHYTVNWLMTFMENNRRLFSESNERHIYSIRVNTSTLISRLFKRTFEEMLAAMQIWQK